MAPSWVKKLSWDVSWSSWRPLRSHLGRTSRPKVVLRASWARLGASWWRLGRILGRLGRVLARKTSSNINLIRHGTGSAVFFLLCVLCFERLWCIFGASGSVFGTFWEPLGNLLGLPGSVPERVRTAVAQVTANFLPSVASCVRLGCVFASSWRRLGASWARLGRILARLGASWSRLGGSWARLGSIFWPSCAIWDQSEATPCNFSKTS